jgi:hypothetical protein
LSDGAIRDALRHAEQQAQETEKSASEAD